MKRQVLGVRRASDDNDQNQMNEKKRMKVVHNESKERTSTSNDKDAAPSIPENSVNNAQSTMGENAVNEVPENSQANDPSENGSHSACENGSFNTSPDSMIFTNISNEMSSEHFKPSSDEMLNGSSESSNNTLQPPVLEPETDFPYSHSYMDEEKGSQDTLPKNSDITNGSEPISENSGQKYESSPMKLEKEVIHQPDDNELPSSSQDNSHSHPVSVEKTDLEKENVIDIDNLMLSRMNVTQLVGHADVVFCVAVDENIVLSSSGDTTIKVWNVDLNKEICSFPGHIDTVTCVVLLSEKQSQNLSTKFPMCNALRIAMSASLDCHIKLWSVFEGQEILSLYTFNGITSIGYLESDMYAVVGTEGGKIELWDLAASKSVHSVHAHGDSISTVKVEESFVYSASIDGTVKVWSFEEDELQPLYTRRRKEPAQDKSDFVPTHWKSLAAKDNILYLGDNSSNLKVLDWRRGRLRLFRNQKIATSICEAVMVKHNILLSSFYDSLSDVGGINVWRLPEMSYVCTLTGEMQDICSLDMFYVEKRLRIVSGGHQLLVWDFDFSLPPEKNAQDAFVIKEIEMLGEEIDEKLKETERTSTPRKSSECGSSESSSDKKNWCNVM